MCWRICSRGFSGIVAPFLAVWLSMMGFAPDARADPGVSLSRDSREAPGSAKPAKKKRPAETRTAPSLEKPEPATPLAPSEDSVPCGSLQVDVTDVVGRDLPAWVELHGKSDPARRLTIDVPNGRAETQVPMGTYIAYVYVYSQDTLILVDALEVNVPKDSPTFMPANLLEGASGNRPVRAFDKDGDCVIDRVELACGTDPEDAASVPGRESVRFTDAVLSKEGRWYRGELHAHSVHGGGRETVAQLIRRAEKQGLDFLAITDRNTLAACADPDFHSDSVALIPAMEWGRDDMGVALIYGPKTVPLPPASLGHAQAVCDCVQAQGGVFAVAQPCTPASPWKWGVRYVNAIEVWYSQWRQVPPVAVEQLGQDLMARHAGKLVYSIAIAAATSDLSANGQAAIFWQNELAHGLKACAIAGSGTGSPDVPMGRPLTYVYATEKSAAGILNGLRRGRTFLSAGPDGPKIRLLADVLDDRRADVSIGGAIPLNVGTRLEVTVQGAKGKRLEILVDGLPVVSKVIESDNYVHLLHVQPTTRCSYQARVIDAPAVPGFGPVDVLALTSSIYAEDITQEILLAHPEIDPAKVWVDVRPDPNAPREIDESVLEQMGAGGQITPQWEF